MNPNFEKYIRQTLQDREEEVNADAIWQQVEPHVRPEKKRRKYFWWFFCGTLAGLMTIGALNYALKETTPIVQNGTSTAPEVKEEKIRKQPSIIEKLNERKVTDFSKLKEIDNTNENAIAQIQKEEQTNENEFIKIAAEMNSSESEFVKPVVGKERQSSKDSNFEIPKGPIISPSSKQRNEIVTNKVFDEKAIQSLSDSHSKIELFSDEANAEETKAIDQFQLREELRLDSKIASLFIDEETAEALIPGSVMIQPVPRHAKFHFALGLYTGLGMVQADLSQSEGGSDYLARRKNTETQLESFSAGLGLTVKRKKFSFRTGLEYHRIARRMNFEESTTTYDTIPNATLTTYINSSTGDTLYDRGEAINSFTKGFQKEHFNYFHRLDVPLMLGYEFPCKKILIGMEVGTYVNVLLNRKGVILADTRELTFYDLKTDEEAQWYKTKLGLTPVVRLNFSYSFAPGFQLQASPYYRFKSKYTTSANLVTERYADWGMQIGLRYWLK